MKKKKLLIWGTGQVAEQFMNSFKGTYSQYYTIIGFVDQKDRDDFYGIEVYKPDDILRIDWDSIFLCVGEKKFQNEMLEYLDSKGITRKSVYCYTDSMGMNLLTPFVKEKYKYSDDSEIKKILEYLEEHSFSVYNQYIPQEEVIYKVHQDEDGEPYVYIEDKRMYYPKEYLDITKTPYLKNIFQEQFIESPHLYLRENHTIKAGDVIVDAGVCEGNFSIKHIDIAKKIYLIEMDKLWCKALEKTFAPYRNKVVIHNTMLSKEDNFKEATLDTLIKEKIDFLKMDIEGAEVDALLGAKELLTNSNALCSICAYHHSNDEKYIRYLLESYGYRTEVSNGYMAFIWDNAYFDTLDFRHGIVYGKRMNRC